MATHLKKKKKGGKTTMQDLHDSIISLKEQTEKIIGHSNDSPVPDELPEPQEQRFQM